MSVTYHTHRRGTGYGSGLWPLLLSLLVVLIPTACVLWFLNQTVQNERLAARQKLLEAYRSHLPVLRDRLDAYWQQEAEALDRVAGRSAGPVAFAACVEAGLADSVVCYEEDQGKRRLCYPAPAVASNDSPLEDEAWVEASRLEHVDNDPLAAAAAFGKIAAATTVDQLAARALQAQARCLARGGRADEAIRVLLGTLGRQEYAQAVDPNGRLIAADAQLRALELHNDGRDRDVTAGSALQAGAVDDGDRVRAALGQLDLPNRFAKQLADYRTPLPAAQRRFLMKEVSRLTAGRDLFRPRPWTCFKFVKPSQEGPGRSSQLTSFQSTSPVLLFPTLPAEELAAAYLEANPPTADDALRASGLADVWHFASPSRRVVALLRGESVSKRAAGMIAAEDLPPDVRIALAPPGAETTEGFEHFLPAGPKMPGWQLTLSLRDRDATQGAMSRRMAVNVWIAVLVIAAMSIVAMAVGGAFRRQMRLTRLKNDLLATVSHELKTPLASIRLLVDTLLDAERLDVPKTRDYLRLVAKENARLSHLIDNFLSFSRMERGKQAFEFAEVPAGEVAQRAAEVMADRFQAPACRLEVQTAPDTPPLWADCDALVTAVLNLLDNAYKYTGDCKQVVLRTYAENGNVCFAVNDNGVGLSPRAVKKVFRPFYQVDQRLSRSAGGCGLGLSIVQFIVAAHGGTVRVESKPGAGSTFTILLPQSGGLRS